jgi:hypothetical protein
MDGGCFKDALKTGPVYVGMVVSRNKVPALYKRLREEGLHPEKDPQLHFPTPLDLGSREPAAVALAVIMVKQASEFFYPSLYTYIYSVFCVGIAAKITPEKGGALNDEAQCRQNFR